MPKSYLAIHNRAVVIDTHNDILTKSLEYGYLIDDDLSTKTHSDLTRFKKGGVNIQFFAVWCDENRKSPFNYALSQIKVLEDLCQRSPNKIKYAANYKAIVKLLKEDLLIAMIGIEGGHMIEGNLDNINSFFDKGVRYMTLTWNNSTSWATSAADEKNKNGLSDFGKEVVKRMNNLGMMIDVSHVNEQTFWDVIESSTKPILATHSNAYRLCPHPRNLKDDQIKAIADKNGVVQVNFFSAFLDPTYMERKDAFVEKHKAELNTLIKKGMSEYNAEDQLFINHVEEADKLRSPLSLLIDHIEYIIDLVGIDHVGIGADYDGMPSPPIMLDDVSTYPLITQALLEKGYNETGIAKILGKNLLRVLKENEVTPF